MTILKFSDEWVKKFPNMGEHIQTKYFWSIVSYIIDSKYRKSVKLSAWLKEQIDKPCEALIKLGGKIPKSDDTDTQMRYILSYMHKKFKYIGDTKVWGMSEKWQTANVSAQLMHGDCEDGAILIYVIARLLDIPANKMVIFAGNVKGGGHAFLGYRPKNFPLNWAIMDWCYWYTGSIIRTRPLFYVNKQTFEEYKKINGIYTKVTSKYYKMWFCFNEDMSTRTLRLKK